MPRVPLNDLLAETYRLTLFTPTAIAPTAAEAWWRIAAESAPDEAARKGNTVTATGTVGGRKLLLRTDVIRADLVMLPTVLGVDEQLPPGQVPNIGNRRESLNAFTALVARLLADGTVPSLSRMAFGAVLVHPEVDRRAGYLRLPDYLPVRIDPEWTDFLFQANQPTPSNLGIDGLAINGLSKWSITAFQTMLVQFTGNELVQEPSPDRVFSLRIELDINTVPEFRGPVDARRMDVYQELVAIGMRIAEQGVDHL
jgi:hypothetical protein